MTWKEFKDAVEAQGVNDNDVMAWIDMDAPGGHGVSTVVGVGSHSDNSVQISGYFEDDDPSEQPS